MHRGRAPYVALLLALAMALPAGAVAPSPTGLPGADPSTAAQAATATGERCLVGGHDLPIGLGACPGVRPGAAVRAPQGTCTLNFVVRGRPLDPDAGSRRTFIGTAGHCVLESAGERTWAPGSGPAVTDGAGKEIGRVVYARLGETSDYALIEPGSGVTVEPTVCHFGGPRGTAGTSGDTNVLVRHSGRGTGFSAVAPGRSHLARRFDDPQQVRFDGPASPGDSGAPLLRSDQAVGVVVSIGTNAGGAVRAVRLGPQLQRAGSALEMEMTLVDAPTGSLLSPPATAPLP